ncbi:Saccharopine dehydrogenase, NADP-dependent [Desulfotomaculum arcticum]|uniref:Saccharopine dehydrogenase, NADP-dependent n=2 Tax=Desulfotruncus TaxID=2867377 RepID=A0A1I2QKZ4_9FIRM|nr:Saccharopine dehydrogenase, NADP-dependent [Desulfotomaculum arcticum] [Desulfotruncus arcticus DSM 17038]
MVGKGRIEYGGNEMIVLLLGTGAVGEAYAVLAKIGDPRGEWLEKLVLADYDLERAQKVQARLGDQGRFPAEQVDVTKKEQVVELIQKYQVDLVMNACAQVFNVPIFDGAYEAGCNYMDMAMTLSEINSEDPYHKTGVMLGDYQFACDQAWKDKGQLALLGMGIDPGVSEIFAKYAEKNLFDQIDEIAVRDGSNMEIEGYDFAPSFSIWSVLEECTNPPVYWDEDKGWYTAHPMSGSEIFDFPEGIGSIEVVSVEHEEVINLPRWINKGLKKVSFKIGLGREFVNIIKLLYKLGLTSKELINVKGMEVAPRDVVEACLPNPAELGHQMKGKICVGTLVKGFKDNEPRDVYIYQVADNQVCMNKLNCQAVAAQTACGSIIATELLARKIWRGAGVLPPEAFEPEPFMGLMEKYGFPYRIIDKSTT